MIGKLGNISKSMTYLKVKSPKIISHHCKAIEANHNAIMAACGIH